MSIKPSYEILQQRVTTLEKQLADQRSIKNALKEAHQDREAILKTILNSAPVGITRVQGRVFSLVNDQFNEMLGYDKGALIGKNTRIIYADDEEYDRFGKILYGQVRKRGFGEIDLRMKRKDGTVIDVNLRAVPIDPGDMDKGIISTTLNITDRKRAAMEKKQAEQRIKHLNLVLKAIRNVNQVIFREHDRKLLIQAVCDNLVKTRGYIRAWVILFDEIGDVEIAVEAGVSSEFETLSKMMKEGQLPVCAQRALDAPGIQVIMDQPGTCADCPMVPTYVETYTMACQLVYDQKIYGIIVVAIPSKWGQDPEELSLLEEVGQDISFALHGIETGAEREQAEKELILSQERLQTILNSIDTHIYVADMDTYEILFMNQKMQKDFGGDFTGRICWEVFRGEAGPCQNCTNDKLVDEKGQPTGVHFWEDEDPITHRRYINHDRAIPWTDDRLVKIQIATDITDLKNMESQFHQAQKMEAVGTLAGGIAHDFNNILSAVIGYTDLALDEAKSDPALIDYLEQVAKAGRRAKDLVAQILALSRRTKSELMPVQIHLIVKEALKLIDSILPSTIQINQRISTFGKVLADPGQIHQVFMNLVTNAHHAMRQAGGELKIHLTETVLDATDDSAIGRLTPGPYLILCVADTGTGMDSDVQSRIFDPYFTTKGKDEGTGLGLAVVHGIVESLGGAITVKSVLGQGTTFKVYLPKLEKEMQAMPAVEKISIPTGNERILFIDDESALIKIAHQMLETLGYRVTIFNNSLGALECFRDKPEQFDLVITDMTMPGITGDVLAAEIMKIRTDIPVIICTGFSERINMEKTRKMGVRALLIKPLSKTEMAMRIREVLDGKSTQPEPPIGNGSSAD